MKPNHNRRTDSRKPGGRARARPVGQTLHFGLGADGSARTVEIRWPSGIVQTLSNVAGDRIVVVEEAEAGGK